MELSQSYEERIISYLRSQEIFGEDDFQVPTTVDHCTPEEVIGDVLNEVINNVIKRIICHDKFENTTLGHNQYPLFDLSNIITDFCMNEDIMKQISFRESVLISKVDSVCGSREVEPKAVGGLCLNIQTVDGYIPEKISISQERKIDNRVATILKKARQVRLEKMQKGELKSEWNNIFEDDLRRYEKSLKNQMQRNCKKFVVHLSSEFEITGQNAGSSLTSWVDRNFHTIEEKRSEYIQISDGSVLDKNLYIALQKGKYYLHYRGADYEEKKQYSLVKTRDLVCEGANLILMRYLALTKYTGTFELTTTYINGDLCRNIYECIGSTKGIINDKKVEICKIYRYIIEQCGIEHHCVTVLTDKGYIISQEWEGCTYILNKNPILALEDGPIKFEKIILAKTWTDDVELLSRYLDYKTEAEMKMKRYLYDHPEVKEIFSDFVNNILLLKPNDILPFTMSYFQTLCPIKIPIQSYFESIADDIYF